MRFHDRTAYRQPHAHALRLRRIEGMEETPEALWAQPGAGIPHRDDDAMRAVPGGTNGQVSRSVVGEVTHRLDGIHHQIEHHLLELNPVS